VNSVFASSTLPVSVNVRGAFLNQVYMGVFRPDANSLAALAGQRQAIPRSPRIPSKQRVPRRQERVAIENPNNGFNRGWCGELLEHCVFILGQHVLP
jgi:hypothetical protein